MIGGPAPPLHFSVVDKWGQLVEVTVDRWFSHVLRNRPEMTGRKDLVKQATNSPQIVYEGHTVDDKCFVATARFHKILLFGSMVEAYAVKNFARPV